MRILIVVDMQNDFIDGALGTPEAHDIVPEVVGKIEQYVNIDSSRIIFTKDTHTNNYLDTQEGRFLPIEHCIENTDGSEISRHLKSYLSLDRKVSVISKHTFGCHAVYQYVRAIKNNNRSNIESIELVGLCTDCCIISNVVLLKTEFPEIPICVDASCCAGTTPEAHKKAIELMRDSLQVYVINYVEDKVNNVNPDDLWFTNKE